MNQFDRGLGKLRFGAGGKLGLDDVAWDEQWPHPPTARAPDVGSEEPLVRSHQTDHPTMLAVTAQRTDDRLSLGPHPRGWK
jgi:hypothetical protein